MELMNMDSIPPGIADLLGPFADEIIKVFGDRTLSIIVYGEATGPDYVKGKTDINVAVVVSDYGFADLERLAKPVRRFAGKKVPAPLILTKEYINRSLDSFPIEFYLLKDTGSVLWGEDVLSGIDVDKGDLRRECEAQLKGKMVTVKQIFMEQALNRKGLENLVYSTIRSLMPVFRSVIVLNRSEAPRETSKILKALKEDAGIDVLRLEGILGKGSKGVVPRGASAGYLLEGIMEQIEKLGDYVDKME